ncbi:MAG: hypothetical protein RLY57_489 [Candidatus Parcubacteria bacterium]|jgi:hypothetical protein
MKTLLIFIVVVLAGLGVYYYSTHEDVVPVVSYYIGKEQVTKEVFMELKGQLTIDAGSVISSRFELSQGVFGGNEEQYKAVRKEGGKEYLYTIVTYANGDISASIISE